MRQLKKEILTVFIPFFFTTTLLGQSNFLVEGQTIKTGTIIKTYNFGYQSNDNISLFFSDSTIEYSNPSKTVVKKTSFTGSKTQPLTNIQYFRTNGEDSISKHFNGDDLTMIYETKFDNLDRIVVYSMTDLRDSTNGFIWTYEYQDSIISTGKIVIQTIYVNDDNGEKKFHFRVLNEFDMKNRIVKETRESKVNDPDAYVTNYSYDNNNQLIDEEIVIIENENKIDQQIIPCHQEILRDLKVSNFTEIKNLIEKLLLENMQMLNSNDCENYFCKYVSLDKQSYLSIVKRKPYWCEGRTVTFSIIQNF
jgi:hypothetical protein